MPRIHRIISISALLVLGASACNSKEDDTTPNEALEKADRKVEKTEHKVEQAGQKVEHKVDEADRNVDEEVDAPSGDAHLESRFEGIEQESKEEFVKRAREAITALETELAAAKVANKSAESIKDIESSIDEANKDLDEIEHGTTKVIDDGKVGVTLAINAARRKLDRLNDD
ncbi:hypothetical protein [Paraliomyxa miuraensis]|uniref:hypothetical protein n=1 Tax=Paraliomyxa miuraensis TaxID=376150 RepID=UPI00225C1915|nr:hypothetical protein [Paraliomyxa miuraensis]MCX4239237.1 hypothetical protein [Paraliomyxa miuraensis]